jgi:hypothetical protein
MSDESRERIERLETATRRLLVEVADLRQELRGLRAVVAPGSVDPAPVTRENVAPASLPRGTVPPAPVPHDSVPPASSRPAAEPGFLQRILDPPRAGSGAPRAPRQAPLPRPGIFPQGMSFEDLIGRYGAMALAALAIMSGVGIFLSWAIAQNLIGPAVRVSAGFAAAAALAALGWRLRNRNARTFGNTLMGIALAVVHVVAWGAGPGLAVMPNWLALGVAAAASVALALLAWRSDEQSLFVVGVGGALIAPFVTTPGRGNGEALLVFGWLVLTTALWGMRERPWRAARWLLGAAGVAYAAAAMTAAWSADGIFSKEAPAVFALACAWGALALGGRLHAPGLVRAYLLGALPPLFWNWDAAGVFLSHLVLAGAGTLTLFVGVHRTEEPDGNWILGTLLLPLGFLTAALMPLDDIVSTRGALVALGWAVAAAGAGWLVPGRRREILWIVAAVASAIAIVFALSEKEIAMIAALSAHVAAVSIVMRRERAGLLIFPAIAVLVVAAGALWIQLDLRPPFSYTPFLTSASLGALALVLGVGVLGWNAARTELGGGGLSLRERRALQGLGFVAAFMWGHVELAEAYSPDLSVFLLIIYYAACGVAAIFIGRRDSMADVRRIGLGLAIFAALKAVAQGYELETVGLRVGSFLLVGGFLLAVAYWYRAAGETARTSESDAR